MGNIIRTKTLDELNALATTPEKVSFLINKANEFYNSEQFQKAVDAAHERSSVRRSACLPARMALHTRSGVMGSSKSRTPTAS